MDTKEALKELEDLTVDYGNRNEEQIARLDEAIDMAMEALRAQPEKRTEERTKTHACDCISRQEVIDTVHKIIYGFFSEKDGVMTDTEKTLLSVNKLVCNGVRELPPAQSEQRWIPCSERLPEDGQDVLFCDIDEDIMLGYHVKGRPDTHFTQCGSWDEIKNVFAWMPLPEPYRAERRTDG